MGERVDCCTVTAIEPNVWYVHPNAVSDGECYEGCCDDYKCPDCGTRWREAA